MADMAGTVTVVNPFGSVLTQNKLCFAFMWDHAGLFSEKSRHWIREYIPETRRLEERDKREIGLDVTKEEWVLKSVYGCEGDSVVCGPFVSERDWRETLEKAIPRHWIAQRFFEVQPDQNNLLPNFGVYVIGGRAAGFYTRLSSEKTDYRSVTTPTYIAKPTT